MRQVALLLAALLLPAVAGGQDWRGPAALEVQVEDAKGRNLAGAEILLVYLSPEGGGSLPSVLTDANGKANIGGLAAGRWTAEIRHSGQMSFRAELTLAADAKPVVQSASHLMAPGATSTMKVKFGRGRGGAPAPAPPAPKTLAQELPPPAPVAPAAAPAPAQAAAKAPVKELSPAVSVAPAPAPVAPAPAAKAPVQELPPAVPVAPAPAPVAPAPAPAPVPAAPAAKAPVKEVPPAVAAAPVPAPVPAAPAAKASVKEKPLAGPVAPVPAPAAAPAPEEAPKENVPPVAPVAPVSPVAPAPAQVPPSAAPVIPAPAPVAVPAAPAAPAAVVPAPTAPAAPIRARLCVECPPGESAAWGEAAIAGGATAGCPADLQARLRAVDLGAVGALSGELEAAGLGCRVVAVELPAGARFTGFRFEAQSAGVAADCLPGRDCPAGGCRFPNEPVLRVEGNRTTLLVAFESTAPDLRRAVVAGYSTYSKR